MRQSPSEAPEPTSSCACSFRDGSYASSCTTLQSARTFPLFTITHIIAHLASRRRLLRRRQPSMCDAIRGSILAHCRRLLTLKEEGCTPGEPTMLGVAGSKSTRCRWRSSRNRYRWSSGTRSRHCCWCHRACCTCFPGSSSARDGDQVWETPRMVGAARCRWRRITWEF